MLSGKMQTLKGKECFVEWWRFLSMYVFARSFVRDERRGMPDNYDCTRIVDRCARGQSCDSLSLSFVKISLPSFLISPLSQRHFSHLGICKQPKSVVDPAGSVFLRHTPPTIHHLAFVPLLLLLILCTLPPSITPSTNPYTLPSTPQHPSPNPYTQHRLLLTYAISTPCTQHHTAYPTPNPSSIHTVIRAFFLASRAAFTVFHASPSRARRFVFSIRERWSSMRESVARVRRLRVRNVEVARASVRWARVARKARMSFSASSTALLRSVAELLSELEWAGSAVSGTGLVAAADAAVGVGDAERAVSGGGEEESGRRASFGSPLIGRLLLRWEFAT